MSWCCQSYAALNQELPGDDDSNRASSIQGTPAMKAQRSISASILIDESHVAIWQNAEEELKKDGITDIFHINDSYLARDSGFSDIKKLLYPTKYIYASMMVISCIGNSFAIATEDLPLIREKAEHIEDKFLITKAVGALFLDQRLISLDRLVPVCELACLIILIMRIMRKFVMAALKPCFQSDKARSGYFRWSCLSNVFLVYIPYLATFSAMKLLYYVTPAVVTTEAYNWSITIHGKINKGGVDKAEGYFFSVWYIFSRLLCLVIGFDAFLVKFRIVETYVDSEHVSLYSVAYCMFFVFQILSIVNLRTFTRERLFLFIFAGEDGELNVREEATKEVWCALLCKQAFKQLGVFKGTVVLLGFDDYDYQLLVLDTNAKFQEHKQLLEEAQCRRASEQPQLILGPAAARSVSRSN